MTGKRSHSDGVRILAVGGDTPPEGALAEAVRALRAGWPVVLPTDTVYGLAALAGDARAAGRLFALKGRPPELAVPVLLASVAQVDDLAVGVTDGALALMDAFWPGGITVVVRRRPGVGRFPFRRSGSPVVRKAERGGVCAR